MRVKVEKSKKDLRCTTLTFTVIAFDELYTFLSLTCEEVRLVCLEGSEIVVSRSLFHPEIASESNFDLETHFGLFLQHSLSLNVARKSHWCTICSYCDFLQTLLFFCVDNKIRNGRGRAHEPDLAFGGVQEALFRSDERHKESAGARGGARFGERAAERRHQRRGQGRDDKGAGGECAAHGRVA